uniref:N-alpha-acetyltransferase 50-like n=1 Tax=Jaculus jaculus TaxID=51337 RepID=UPI001E1B3165|nr:N-alpha-acetyltransferase 50-like [Jaculus jaculus]
MVDGTRHQAADLSTTLFRGSKEQRGAAQTGDMRTTAIPQMDTLTLKTLGASEDLKELGDVTPHNIKQLKRLNQVIFPVSYNDKFYKDVLEVGELAKLAYFNDIAVGAVCCRVDHSQNQKRLYIMTLGCLAPYRRLGIGTKMLNHVLNICEKDGTSDNIYLHVQISNESAIDFYRKFGFEIIETKKKYYKRIEPADAHVLQKNLKVPSGQSADTQKTDN